MHHNRVLLPPVRALRFVALAPGPARPRAKIGEATSSPWTTNRRETDRTGGLFSRYRGRRTPGWATGAGARGPERSEARGSALGRPAGRGRLDDSVGTGMPRR